MTHVKDMIKKMCVIGEAAVGKTSLIRRFVVDKFDDRYIATIGSKTSAKSIQIPMDELTIYLKLQIWDIVGMRSFSTLQKSAYKGASGAFLVLDLTRKETLYTFDSWLMSLYNVAGNIPVVVLANKNDKITEIQDGEIKKISEKYGFPYFITSAKTGENVNKAFHILGEMMLKSWKGPKIEPKLDLAIALEKQKEVEIKEGRKLTELEVEDIIMAGFCDLLDDQDIAMSIIRVQFKRAELDFKYPTVEGLTKVTNYLLEAVSNQVEPSQIEKERRVYLDLIRRIG